MIDSFRGPYVFLSNFAPAPVKLALLLYPTVEHAFQAAKTHDLAMRVRIQVAASPAAAKALGRRVALRDDWEVVKCVVMHMLLRQKFVKGSSLADALLATGDEPLLEGNTWGDRFWGACLNSRGEWVGVNNLGKLLMTVRGELR